MPAKVCLITGASRGIGLATALRFARNGWHTVLVARGEPDLKQALDQVTATGGECEAVVADVGNRKDAQRAIELACQRFGRIDALVNNAGASPLAPIDQLSPVDFERALATNIAGVFHMTQLAWPILRTQKGGTIVSISSAASVDPFPGFAVYGACKAWVNLFTTAIAEEGRPHGIQVYAVALGGVETGMFRSHFPDVPPEQVLQPDEVATLIESLCDQRTSHTSGETVFIRKQPGRRSTDPA